MAIFRDGQEEESGTIQRDPAGTRGRRDNPGTIEEVWRASSDGTPGDRQRDPAGAQAARTAAAEPRTSEGCHRQHSGDRSTRAAETAAHRTSHLRPPARGAPVASHRRTNRAALRAGPQACTVTRSAPGVRPANLRVRE